jgi:hypothetical protein
VHAPVAASIDVRSTSQLGRFPAGRPLHADQITEYHAARLLLVVHLCGTKNRIKGLTKLAKLDFFVRYPSFFAYAKAQLEGSNEVPAATAAGDGAMIRHHYGPWDPRYYQILAYLEGRELLDVGREKNAYVFSLSPKGAELASALARDPAYLDVASQMRQVKSVLGPKSGDALKKLVYSLFDEEVARLRMGTVIQP